MSDKKKKPRTQKRKPIEIDTGGAFARYFEEMMTALFKEAGYCPEPAKVIDLNEWREGKKTKS